jgi:hypothetical protein
MLTGRAGRPRRREDTAVTTPGRRPRTLPAIPSCEVCVQRRFDFRCRLEAELGSASDAETITGGNDLLGRRGEALKRGSKRHHLGEQLL